MPIYAYKCSSCGVAKDILRKISDAPLTLCPACGKDALEKQVTAAGFQLKGSGWYVTDFRDGKPGAGSEDKAAGAVDGSGEKAASDAPSVSSVAPSAAPTSTQVAAPNMPAAAKSAPTPAPPTP